MTGKRPRVRSSLRCFNSFDNVSRRLEENNTSVKMVVRTEKQITVQNGGG